MERGNPPGKRNSSGDALSWESLLAVVPSGTALNLITGDSDFQNPLDTDRPQGSWNVNGLKKRRVNYGYSVVSRSWLPSMPRKKQMLLLTTRKTP